MYLKIVCVLVALFCACTSATKMSSCTDSAGVYPNVTYSINSYMCESSPCTCTLGCPSLINFDFLSPRYLEHIKPKIHVTALGVQLDYPLGQDDACVGFTNTQCPIVQNEKINYQYSLTIPAIFPEVTVTLRFTLIDKDTNTDVVCFEWDIAVKKDDCPA